MPRFSIIATLVAVASLHFFSCSLCSFDEEYPEHYYLPLYKSEVLVVDGDTVGSSNDSNGFGLSDSMLVFTHFGLHLTIIDLPALNKTKFWTDNADTIYYFAYMKKKIEKYSVAVTRIPYDAEMPPNNLAELVDSVAFHIDCIWEDDNSYSVDIHAKRYLDYSTN